MYDIEPTIKTKLLYKKVSIKYNYVSNDLEPCEN